MNLLEIKELTKAFSREESTRVVLDGVSLNLPSGTWMSVLGKSGSGKSTLLRCASGLAKPDSGSVTVAGTDIVNASPDELAILRRSHLGFVFQNYTLIESLTVGQNVALPLLLAKRTDDVEHIVGQSLDAVGMGEYTDSSISTLSGGEQQRVAIARALAQQPAVFFADEPTGALDSVNAARVLDLFRLLTESGVAVLMVTHDLDAAARCDVALVLRDGKPAGFFESPRAGDLYEAIHAEG